MRSNEILAENLESSCVLDLEELEVWEELPGRILNGRTAESPSVFSSEAATGNGCVGLVVLDGLRLVKHNAQKVDAMQRSLVLLIKQLPPRLSLLASLEMNWVILLRI